MDGVIAIGGCDKNMPGAMIAIARMNIPAIFVYGGTIKPGHYAGRDLTVVSAFEAVGEYSAGRIDEAELLEVERHACPGVGSCGGMYTANTMSSAHRGDGHEPAVLLDDGGRGRGEGRERRALGARSWSRRSRASCCRAQIMTREAFENAIAVVMALGGSTNAVLHLLAIAHAAEVPLVARRLRAHPRARAGALRPEAVRPLRRDRPAPRRRHAAGDEDAARARVCCTATR